MKHERAAKVASEAAVFLSKLIREKRIPDADKEQAGDLAIDLSLVSKAHTNLAFEQVQTSIPTGLGVGTHSS